MNLLKVRMKVDGGDKIARKLQMLAQEAAKKHIREAALEGAEVIRKRASEVVAEKGLVQTGTLRDNIDKEVVKQTKARVEIEVGPSKKAWYGKLVELGHKIGTGKRTGEMVAPHPFLGPAFEESHEEAQRVAAEEIRRRLRL